MNQYFVTVRQPPRHKRLEINIYTSDPDEQAGGYLSAVSSYDYSTHKIEFYIRPNISFYSVTRLTPDEALDMADWWYFTAQVVETLPFYIKTVDDFNKTFTAKVVGKSIVIDNIKSDDSIAAQAGDTEFEWGGKESYG